jgi:hypothetical protein
MFMSPPWVNLYPDLEKEFNDSLGLAVGISYRAVYGLDLAFQSRALHLEVEATRYREARAKVRALYSSQENRQSWPAWIAMLPLPVYEDAKCSRATLAKCRKLAEIQHEVFSNPIVLPVSTITDLHLSGRETETLHTYIMHIQAQDSTADKPQHLFRYITTTPRGELRAYCNPQLREEAEETMAGLYSCLSHNLTQDAAVQ